MAEKIRLYHYWRSSCSWRVRWALDFKKIPAELYHVSLINGESDSEAHLRRSPLGYVPALERIESTKEPRFLTDSTAIVRWLEESFPQLPSLFSGDAWSRAQTNALAGIISSDTQPIQNLNVLQRHSADPSEQKRWAQEFIQQGLSAYEKLLQSTAGVFSVGNTLSWADLCLIPQCYNADRYSVDMKPFPTIQRIVSSCQKLDSYLSSHPSQYEPKP